MSGADDTAVDIATAHAWLRGIASTIEAHRDQLTQLDSAIGDGDHGENMRRGFAAVLTALDGQQPTTVGEVLTRAGGILMSSVGGASGPLYGSAFRAAGKELNQPRVDGAQVATALRAAASAVARLGAASPGDKTMLDALEPAVDAFERAVAGGAGLASASVAAARAAEEGAQATVPLLARKGRASYLGPRSIGHRDPGATSTALVFVALAEAVAPGKLAEQVAQPEASG